MRTYWNNLQSREQFTLAGATAILMVILCYLLLIEPYIEKRDRLERSITNQQEDLLWMRQAAGKFKQLDRESVQQGRGGKSLLTLIDQSTKKHKLNNMIKRIQPEGDKVRVQFEKVSFNKMAVWLSELEQSGYSISGAVIERQPEPGQVAARVVIGQRP